ncbi:acetyl-CoA acetyltransferase, cytosolic [Zeugodacus cucurbitae]|uniref:acetyl-CoA acetyltransferase, cytosolic n=1 Tax=Zeugodacus cucurbitae TaxID=28588 RepID=UPI0023D92A93|nr:acetyl-CoA acetyltransferase, cytosolic [Zeugodacus cucurbitae]
MVNAGDVYIVSAARTAIGSFNGSLSKLKASELGSVVIKEVLKRGNVNNDDVDEVIIGQSLTAGQGQNPSRQAALQAGLPISVPVYNINMLCGSGLKTVALGFQSIRCGDSKIVICGGQENMSLAPHVIHLRNGIKMGPGTMLDTMTHDGLTDAMHNIHMGVTAENLVKQYNITRSEQDEFAARSQNLAENAQKNGFFDGEIAPVELKTRAGIQIFEKDEYIKAGTTAEALKKLKPCFIENGTVTAGNASGINDAAAAVLLMSGEEVEKRSIKPMAKIVAWAQTGVDPKIMGIGPVTAVEAVLQKAGWSKGEVDLFELNEAFAGQSIAVLKGLQIDADKVNVNGGAIALGHPIGASGCRVLVTLLYALERLNVKKGVASLCIGGGMGIAMAVERI